MRQKIVRKRAPVGKIKTSAINKKEGFYYATGRLLKKSYQILRIGENKYPKVVYDNLEKLKLYKQLRTEGCCEETALIAIKLKRAKFYRLKSE